MKDSNCVSTGSPVHDISIAVEAIFPATILANATESAFVTCLMLLLYECIVSSNSRRATWLRIVLQRVRACMN
jgi:hypothetical protein